MILKTFEDWSKSGYKIIKGSKAQWINNVAFFDESQVIKYLRFFSNREYDGLLEADAEEADYYGISRW